MLHLLLLLLGLCLRASQQEQQVFPPGRCDVQQRLEKKTDCTSCAAALTARCPRGFSHAGTANCSYEVQIGNAHMELQGCQHICAKTILQPQCCPGFWGPLCLPCPSWSGKICNFNGACMDGDLGNGTCICNDGFSGFACQDCNNPKAFGKKCDQECDCQRGVCNQGPEGDGKCMCQPPYTGKRCDVVSSKCSACSPFSYCKGDGVEAACECLPGYRRSSQNKCIAICSQRDCDINAACSLRGSKITCVCKPGFEGDGRICIPKNPCLQNNGGCPINSTVCVFRGPNKSSCECMSGMSPVGGRPESGCKLLSACSPDTCGPTAVCQTELDGKPRCVCETTQIGDGRHCYGNLMERLFELDASGSQRGNLTGAVALFEAGCVRLLSHSGPFTVFVPVQKTPLTGLNEESVCKNHLILGQHLYSELEGRDITLYGGGRVRLKPNRRFILLDNPRKQYNVIVSDLPAANGVIHIIEQPFTNMLLDRTLRDEKFIRKTVGEILRMDENYNRFLSLVDNCGSPPPLNGPGPLTVFVPTNEAVDRARDGSILYMLHHAKHKLQELLRNHVYSRAVLTVDELTSLPRVQTMANQMVSIRVSDSGEILLGKNGVHLARPNIMASNGVIHMIDGLLYPPSILPILPHRCDVIQSKVTVGPCIHCGYLSNTQCPPGSTEMSSYQNDCEYVSILSGKLIKGCAKYCNTTTQTAECCPGFFGPDCQPCIGGFQHPCYDKGTCFDGIHGNGSCSCHSGFKGVACHICSDPSKHGENCDEDCRCIHGVCDNRPGSGGECRRGSCLEGFSGENCDKKAAPCNSDGLLQHCHIHAFCIQAGLETRCVCNNGYDGDGHSCSPINLCLKSSRGGCDTNADCVYAGPGNVSCVCTEGWTGDGRVCVEINNCRVDGGGCSPDAYCTHIGPGQNECVCKDGYVGNGKECELTNPCTKKNGGCHELAKCEQKEGGLHTCTCPDGYAGDGNICFGSLFNELDLNSELYSFARLVRKFRHSSEDLSQNLTVLVPSQEVLRNMSSDDSQFWTSRHHLPHFLRAHYLLGVYSVEDLDSLVGSSLPTLNPAIQWEVRKINGVLHVGNASILTHNLPAINGYIHIVNQILAPPSSDLPPEPPTLMAFLNSSSNFTLFRKYALMYNMSEDLKDFDFTVLLPTDEAIRKYLGTTNSSVLSPDVFRYHIIPKELLHLDHLHDGLLGSTLLGADYQVQFHLNDRNQTSVNGVPLDSGDFETQFGVVIVLQQVLQISRNRCSQQVALQVSGRCSDCDGAPRCLFSYTPIRPQFPANMKSNCRFRKRIGSRRKFVPGCVMKCLRFTTDHSCCPGYYGHECFKCPGDIGSVCSNHGKCLDGIHGNGECQCLEGFHGTACEDCEPGRYGLNCSSKCVCANGKCDDGLAGSGRCICHKGWKGTSCSVEIKDDACGGGCDDNANCVTGPKGTAAVCVCVAGYEGNGTHCKEMDLCSRSNGGCSEFAVCTKVSAGERTCSCKEGYTGDGVVCLEIDGCLLNNGGCHKAADCTRTGPNKTACTCQMGFQGSGKFCYPVNPCTIKNGGCSKYAFCEYRGQGQRNCSCLRGNIGDGFDCRGTIISEVYRQSENAIFLQMLKTINSNSVLSKGPQTVFVPLEETNKNITAKLNKWKDLGRIQDLVYHHIISCESLSLSDLKTTERAVAVSGQTLQFSLQEGSVWINNRSRIVKSDYTTTSGVIHHIDTLLTPYSLEDKPPNRVTEMNFTTAAVFYGYTRFYKLIEDADLLPVLQMSTNQPFTVFWPTDRALAALPAERQQWLSSHDHLEQLAATVKAHIVLSKLTGISQPTKSSSFRTMHGSTIKFSCDKKLVGSVMINENSAKLVERHLTFKEGVAYGIDQLLEPPGLGAFCDMAMNKTTYGRCGNCLYPPSCPLTHLYTGVNERCRRYKSPFRKSYSGWYGDLDGRLGQSGCRRVCQYSPWVPKCCKNHYGRDCQVCPGGLEAPCSNHGSCRDGHTGSGTCKCDGGFKGKACESCMAGYYGANCTACSCEKQGRCDDGVEGTGTCVCSAGWEGERCQNKLGSIPKECRQCHAQADCVPGTGCQCKPGFQGNGTFCIPEPSPDLCSEYNGGCHQDADCNQTGLVVNCTCRGGYQGDGFSCQPINRCVEEQNGGCSEFATCRFTGPNQRECECLQGYVGNGVQCLEKVVPPVDRCQDDNGGCAAVASCKDLHYHANTAGVFHLQSPEGKYKMNFSQADAACQAEGAILATYKQLADAQQLGMHLCVAGWLKDQKVGYVTQFPSPKCGDNHVGVVLYKDPVDVSSKYDAYCYRVQDVSCSCPDGYTGNGFFCHGVLTSVLSTYSNFSLFYKFLLDYSNSASRGRELFEVLARRTSEVTLFVPHDAGFADNQILSGSDLEYHISTDHSRRLFKDLMHQDVIKSRLGSNLVVTQGKNESSKMVNQRLLLQWDVPAVNGIIHVIQAPLTAPAAPGSHGSSPGKGHSSKVSAILLSLLLLCVLAALGHYIFKHKTDAFQFHYFKNEDEDATNKPALVSIPNPLYSGSSALSEPFGDPGERAEPPEREERQPDGDQ
ncbi:stabilin-1 isoform X1 [Oryzias melastigma]|nr:stabilin-1 isoform X1 [Oryzias melastigma]